MRIARAMCADPGNGVLVDLYRDASAAPLVDLRRRLRAVLDVLAAVRRSGFSVSRGLELTRQWDAVVAAGPMGTVTAGALERASGLGLAEMEVCVAGLHLELDKFLQAIVRNRKEKAVQGWKAWILEDSLVHPKRRLRPGLVPPSPFLQCDPGGTPDGSGVLSHPALIDADVHLLVANVVKSFDTVDRGILDWVLSSLGLPAGFDIHTLSIMLMSGLGLSWLLVWVSLGLAMGAFPRGAL